MHDDRAGAPQTQQVIVTARNLDPGTMVKEQDLKTCAVEWRATGQRC